MLGTFAANIFGLGTGEIVIIAVVVLILFGPKQLPGLGRSIGQFYREIKKGTTDEPPAPSSSKEEKK